MCVLQNAMPQEARSCSLHVALCASNVANMYKPRATGTHTTADLQSVYQMLRMHTYC